MDSPSGRALLAAKIAALQMQRNRELAQLSYDRSRTYLAAAKTESAAKDEESAFFRIFNTIAGTDLNPEKMRLQRLRTAQAKYERLTGHEINSPEYLAKVDAVCEAMLNRKPS